MHLFVYFYGANTPSSQVYMGELRNKCVKNVPEGWNVTHEEWQM